MPGSGSAGILPAVARASCPRSGGKIPPRQPPGRRRYETRNSGALSRAIFKDPRHDGAPTRMLAPTAKLIQTSAEDDSLYHQLADYCGGSFLRGGFGICEGGSVGGGTLIERH
jgi:hypothetical protein